MVSDLLARKLSNSEAADAIKALGCTIEYLEAPGAARWVGWGLRCSWL